MATPHEEQENPAVSNGVVPVFLTESATPTWSHMDSRCKDFKPVGRDSSRLRQKSVSTPSEPKNSSSAAISETRPTSLASDEALNLPRTLDRHSPANRKTQSISLNYRSELKRAVALLLTKDPNVSDLNICRGLDADGAVELPQSLTGGGQRR